MHKSLRRSPKSWAEQLGGGRHDPYLAAAPPTWASSQVERRQTDSQLHNVPTLSPRASKGAAHGRHSRSWLLAGTEKVRAREPESQSKLVGAHSPLHRS